MSHFAFRDSSIIVIETGRTHVRAGLGLHDLLRSPGLEIPARVGLRANTLALRQNGSREDVATTSNGSRASRSNVRVSDYLVGSQLDDALAANEDVLVSWPFADGDITDYVQAEAIWKHILFAKLGLRRTHNESPALLSFVHGLSRDSHESVCQIFFERFNIAALSVLERPLAQLYAVNAISGLVVDIGQDTTDVTPICDCFVQHNCVETVPLGISDCERYLAHIFKSNKVVVNALSPPDSPLSPDALSAMLVEFARHVWKEGLIRVISDREAALDIEDEGVTNIAAVLVAGKEKAVIETGMKKRATAKATAAEQARAREIEALDLVTVTFREQQLTIGRERHRFAEPLFDPSVLNGVESIPEKKWKSGNPVSLQEACGNAVTKADLDARVSIWDSLFVTGDFTSLVKGLGAALHSRVQPFLLSNPDYLNDVQPKHARVLHVPDYFAEYRDKGDAKAAFLGASIVAKIIFADPLGKNFVSKADYISKGPRAVLEMSPSLL